MASPGRSGTIPQTDVTIDGTRRRGEAHSLTKPTTVAAIALATAGPTPRSVMRLRTAQEIPPAPAATRTARGRA